MLLERAFGAAFPKDFLLHPSRSLAGRDTAHALPSPPSSGCTSGQQMLAQMLGTKALATSSRRGRASTAESSQIYVLPGCDDPGEAPGDWEEVPSPPAWHDSQHSTPMACPWLSPSNIPSIPDSAC